MDKQELGAFLRSRRERLRPQDVGLPSGPRRRTPGLRREEVDQSLVLFSAPPGSPGAEALALLNVLGAEASRYLP